MQITFWILLLLAAFPYVIYPSLMWLLTKTKEISWRQQSFSPPITLIISVFNEEEVIRKKLDNSLRLDYPNDNFQVLVVSDGSTDRTHEIIQSIEDPRITLKIISGRLGKTECLNRTIPGATGEILVFTDANSMFPSDMLEKITRNFSDDSIGAITGWTKYRTVDNGEETTGLYAKLEKTTKYGESLVSSCVGADGAIFAIRKEHFSPLKTRDINDFVIPLSVIAAEKRVVLDPDVFCFEQPSTSQSKEFRRQIRITNRTLGALWRGRQFLNPLRYGSFSLFLLSHKLIKFLVPFFFVATLLISLSLTTVSDVYAYFLAGQLLVVGAGVAGLFRWLDGRFVRLCAFFLLTISAQAVGWFRFMTGNNDIAWMPQR